MDRWDVLGLVGLVLLGGGLGLLAPWLGLAAAGAVLFTVAVCGALAAHRQEERGLLAAAAVQKGGER
ncbi:hypothetical protein ACQEV4_42680 [Streptomyces shenzhenensis]|uniref:hypothetical protein n=1 Tax=Streptomyces shenzhenensis TaxID=943815 RepID=UPI003D8B8381